VARIAEDTIQRVAEANDIVEVIGSYFPLKRAGTSFRALCPFHKEKSPSFHVNPQRQSYHCFGCGAGGTIFRFIMEYEHVDFPSAVRRLAQRAGITVVEEAGGPEDDKRHEIRKRLLAIHAEAAAWFHQQLLKSPSATTAREYLKSRNITSEVAKSWQLGYAPDSWDAVIEMLREKGFSAEEIAQSGLTSSRDEDEGAKARSYSRFRDRVMFPIRNDYGEVVAFSGRVLDPEAKTAKYVNSPETPLFTKGRVLYGLDKSKRALIEANTAVVCEGQLDLISAFESGVQNVIAPQGTAFTPEQARLLRRFVETVILCFDSDRAGQEAVTRSLPSLLDCGVSVRVARLPDGEDPDSLIRKQGAEGFKKALEGAKDFFDYAIERLAERGTLNTPAGKADAARRLGPFVAAIKEKVLLEATSKKICARLGITEAAFTPHLKAATPPSSAPEEPQSTPTAPPLVMAESIRVLCRLSLLDPDVRLWLSEQATPSLTQLGEGGSLLEKVVVSPLAVHEPAARAAFISKLSSQEEAALNALDLEYPPEDPLGAAQKNWLGLAVAVLRNKQSEAQARLNSTNLTAAEKIALMTEMTSLHKQILDLQGTVTEAG